MRVLLAVFCAGSMLTGCTTASSPHGMDVVFTIPNETPQRVHGGHLGRSKVSYRGVLTSPATLNTTLRHHYAE
jgi:hypothetical protein